jgi:hypothetical protein
MIQVLGPSQSVADGQVSSVALLLVQAHIASRTQTMANLHHYSTCGFPPIYSPSGVRIFLAATEATWVE